MSSGEGQRTALEPALELLKTVYDAWEELSQGWPLACGPGCVACCTDRVFLTGLEGALLLSGLEERLAARLESQAVSPGIRPRSTFNQRARLYQAGREPPPELEPAGAAGVCPLLGEDGLCPAYPWRPLACRVMVSRRACRSGGAAWQEPFWVELASALFMVVEHLAWGVGGVWARAGLLPEVMAAVRGREGQGLLTCEPLAGIPTPAEHQARLQECLGRLFARTVRGRPLGWWLDELRRRRARAG